MTKEGTMKPLTYLQKCSPEERKAIAAKGGRAISVNSSHMALIGKRGGDRVSQDREHMSRIGKLGGTKKGKMQHDQLNG